MNQKWLQFTIIRGGLYLSFILKLTWVIFLAVLKKKTWKKVMIGQNLLVRATKTSEIVEKYIFCHFDASNI